ncbi:FecR family protein [Flavobacteriaceae bacterium F08102]|nr:FecR family protein [Flavobacteriaceae bacterium F08102]
MSKLPMDKESFLMLLDKFLEGKTSLEEERLLHNYYESFQERTNWHDALGDRAYVEAKMRLKIKSSIAAEENQELKGLGKKSKKSFYVYAVAASIALLITVSLLLMNISSGTSIEKIVEKNDIQIGSDKAILTLEDGTEVSLDKNKTFSTSNVKSNGREIVYEKLASVAEIEYNYLTIPRGGQYFLRLSDGTGVWLNAESKIKFPKSFIPGQPREVELVYGEAYFDVTPSSELEGENFKVISASQVLTVFGTEFNVSANLGENQIKTTLVEGSVSVESDSESHYLKPNEQSVFSKGNHQIQISEVDDIKHIIAWKLGYFSFKEKLLVDIMADLSRWYDVDVDFKNEKSKGFKFTGFLGKGKKIEEILNYIEKTNEVKFTIQGTTIIIE